jgi:hypothetical protein
MDLMDKMEVEENRLNRQLEDEANRDFETTKSILEREINFYVRSLKKC